MLIEELKMGEKNFHKLNTQLRLCIEANAADISSNLKIATEKLMDQSHNNSINVIQGIRVALNLPTLDRDQPGCFDFENQSKAAQSRSAAKRRRQEGTRMFEEFLAKRRREMKEDPDYEYWSDESTTIIMNAWVNHGYIHHNVHHVYPTEEWLRHLDRQRDRIHKENMMTKGEKKWIPSRYFPKPFLYFRRQENKKLSEDLADREYAVITGYDPDALAIVPADATSTQGSGEGTSRQQEDPDSIKKFS